jgi:hypothetical protein
MDGDLDEFIAAHLRHVGRQRQEAKLNQAAA